MVKNINVSCRIVLRSSRVLERLADVVIAALSVVLNVEDALDSQKFGTRVPTIRLYLLLATYYIVVLPRTSCIHCYYSTGNEVDALQARLVHKRLLRS
jgi:hypothetical protein